MARPLFRLTVTDQFSASHQLRNLRGACEALHGHNFGVEVEVEGDVLDGRADILIDFHELKRLLREVLDQLEHRHLNDLAFFAERNPSSENLALFVYTELHRRLPGNVRLKNASVSETPDCKATYSERHKN
jgi:6-pyruvoyltetrahydropterin/6-carboxytetrahydropterin synthase